MQLPVEQQMLLDALRRPHPIGFEERVAELSEKEWTSLINDAIRLRVTPLLSVRLAQTDLAIPGTARDWLKELRAGHSQRNLVLFRQLALFLRDLDKLSIDCIILKGAAIAEELYGDISLRVMRDIDVMLKSDDLEAAARQLEQRGFSAFESYDLGARIRNDKDLPAYFNEAYGVIFELHHHICLPASFPIDVDDLWSNAEPLSVAGCKALRFSAEHQLLHLSLHAAYTDGFQLSIRGLLDVDALLRSSEQLLDWDHVVRLARAWNIDRGLYLTLHLCREHLGTPLPGPHLKALRPDDWTDDVSRIALTQLFLYGDILHKLSPMLIEFIFNPSSNWRRFKTKFLSPKEAAVRSNVSGSRIQTVAAYPRWILKRLSFYFSRFVPLLRTGRPGLRLIRDSRRLHRWMNDK